MSRKEKIKVMIDLYKALLLSFITALFGVLGYTFINYDNFTSFKVVVISFIAILLLACIILCLVLFLKLASKLEKED